MTMIDTMSYFVGSQSFVANSHLVSSTGGNPSWSYWDIPNGIWYQIKGAGGYPWDINRVGPDNIYQSVTEYDYLNANNFKAFNSPFWGANAHGGIAWGQRFIDDSNDFILPLITPAPCIFNEYLACVKQPDKMLGQTVCWLEGPKDIDLGGMLGYQSCLIQNYLWGSTLEVNYYAQGYGHVWWQLFNITGKVFTLKQQNKKNIIAVGGNPTVVFPCTLP